MKIDQNKLRELLNRELHKEAADNLWREENVFFVGGNLPQRQTLETLFESHYQSNAALFHLDLGGELSFPKGERMARLIKKNFNAHLVGKLGFAPSPGIIERAYAAGVDILDIPLGAGDQAASDERLRALERARAVFPRWSLVSTLPAGLEAPSATLKKVHELLEHEVVPLVTLSRQAAHVPAEELAGLFSGLIAGWRASRAQLMPLLPLIYLTTPLVPASSRGALRGFIDLIEGRRLLATSDLRRVLRVKEVEESFASSGL